MCGARAIHFDHNGSKPMLPVYVQGRNKSYFLLLNHKRDFLFMQLYVSGAAPVR